MGVIALVLVGVCLTVVKTTRDHLVEQVDRQLRGPVVLNRIGPRGGPPPDLQTCQDQTGLSALYVAYIRDDWSLCTIAAPRYGEVKELPEVAPATLQAAYNSNERFTIDDPAGRYRATVALGRNPVG